MKNNNQRLMRWSLFLQTFELDIRHIRGKDNVVVFSLFMCFFLLFFLRKGGRGKGKITCIPTIYSLKGEGVTCMCEIYILSP